MPLTTATVDGHLLPWGFGALVLAGVCVGYFVVRKQRRWLIGTAILGIVGALWLVSAFTASTKTESLTVTGLYYTYGNCKETAGTPIPTGDLSCGLRNNVLDQYVKTNQGTFEDPPNDLYDHMQVGRTYRCEVMHYSSIVAPKIESCTL